MRGLRAVMRRRVWPHVGGASRFPGDHLRSDPGGVVLCQEPVERVVDERRVAEGKVAIDIGVPHGLDRKLARRRRMEAEFPHRIAFEDVEEQAERRSAGAWRWR